MFILANLLHALARVLDIIIPIIYWVVIIRALISWVNPDPMNPIVRLLYSITEPILRPFRRLLPPWKTGGLDVSPIIVILLLIFLQYFLVASLEQIAVRLRNI